MTGLSLSKLDTHHHHLLRMGMFSSKLLRLCVLLHALIPVVRLAGGHAAGPCSGVLMGPTWAPPPGKAPLPDGAPLQWVAGPGRLLGEARGLLWLGAGGSGESGAEGCIGCEGPGA